MNTPTLQTHFRTQRPGKLSSPPARAMKNYLKASEASASAPLDSVNISEAAQQKPAGRSGLRKTASYLALGVAMMGALGANSAMAAEAPQQEVVSQSEQAGREVREIGLEIGRQGKEVGKEAAEVGKAIGKEAAEVGKEIGRHGANFGKGVGKAAKGFWRGLTGKGQTK